MSFALNSGKDSISYRVAFKTIFQRVAILLEISKFVNFIELKIVELPLVLGLVG